MINFILAAVCVHAVIGILHITALDYGSKEPKYRAESNS